MDLKSFREFMWNKRRNEYLRLKYTERYQKDPEPWETISHFNPIYYMISLVRYGFLGIEAVNVWLCFGALTAATAVLFVINLRLFQRGYKLRA